MDQDDLPKTPQEILEVKNFSFQEDIGSLWWLAQISRPDIFLATHRCSKWQNSPSKKLWRWLDRIKKYLAKTPHFGITFDRKFFSKDKFVGFADASYACEDGFRSRVGWLLFLEGALFLGLLKIPPELCIFYRSRMSDVREYLAKKLSKGVRNVSLRFPNNYF